ncbi:hypothetical protein K2X83_01755 [Patescibacteria group bacterium]|nr:hypothetical protein [Patescibacteria group bacterium]
MSAEGYRAPDYSLPHRIGTHEFGKAYASALFAPARFTLEMAKYSLGFWGISSPHPEEERGVVIPFSQFSSFYERRSERKNE